MAAAPNDKDLLDLLREHGLDDEERIKHIRRAADVVQFLVYLKTVFVVAGVVGGSISAFMGAGLLLVQLLGD